jgi:RimJ/RimL family protein N-acetyltransferase
VFHLENNGLALETPRLILRRWREEDFGPFARLNADPRVMEFFPAPLLPEEAQALIKDIEKRFERHGFSLWATELKATRELIGFVGLNVPTYPLPFSPCVEIGWRLAFEHWGKGYAQEAAQASLRYGFEKLGLKEVVSFTAVANQRSRRVMERIGMRHDPEGDFDHPKLPEGHWLRRHLLYRISDSRSVSNPEL